MPKTKIGNFLRSIRIWRLKLNKCCHNKDASSFPFPFHLGNVLSPPFCVFASKRRCVVKVLTSTH